jgi:hypothetical protein
MPCYLSRHTGADGVSRRQCVWCVREIHVVDGELRCRYPDCRRMTGQLDAWVREGAEWVVEYLRMQALLREPYEGE